LENDLHDENMKGIDEWFARQNRYSRKEAEHELDLEAQPLDWRRLLARDPMQRRAALKQVAARLPAKALAHFVYSYVVRGGFLDGVDGLMLCAMRTAYQQMIVAKKYDLRRGAGR